MTMEITTQDWLRFFNDNPSSASEIVSFARTLYDIYIYSYNPSDRDDGKRVANALSLKGFKCAARYFHVRNNTQEDVEKTPVETLNERYSVFLERQENKFVDLHTALFDAIHIRQSQRLTNKDVYSNEFVELSKAVFILKDESVKCIYDSYEDWKDNHNKAVFRDFSEKDERFINNVWGAIEGDDLSNGLEGLKEIITRQVEQNLQPIRDDNVGLYEQKKGFYEKHFNNPVFFAIAFLKRNQGSESIRDYIKYAAYDIRLSIKTVFEDLCECDNLSEEEIGKGLARVFAPENKALVEASLKYDTYSMMNESDDSKNVTSEYLDLLMNDTNVILQGAPGVGKTFITQQIKDYFEKRVVKKSSEDSEDTRIEFDSERTAFVTFHQSMDYEDFVEGIHAETKNGNIEYSIEDGIFKRFCRKASARPNEKFLLIIDEINRGNVSKIFGELITLLEQDKREWGDCPIHATLPYSKETFIVPSNLYILGTMNTTDRSVGNIDYALRRRFTFCTIPSNGDHLEGKAKELFNAVKEFINRKHSSEIQSADDIMVGHSYFMKDDESLKRSWEYKIQPLLEEYVNDGLLTKDAGELLKKDMDGFIEEIKKSAY